MCLAEGIGFGPIFKIALRFPCAMRCIKGMGPFFYCLLSGEFFKTWYVIQMNFALLPNFFKIFFPTGNDFKLVHRYIHFTDPKILPNQMLIRP